MHDWTFVSLTVDWINNIVIITFKDNNSLEKQLVAGNLVSLQLSRREPWGESISVNSVLEPTCLANGNQLIEIEIQSGDSILLEAKTMSTL